MTNVEKQQYLLKMLDTEEGRAKISQSMSEEIRMTRLRNQMVLAEMKVDEKDTIETLK